MLGQCLLLPTCICIISIIAINKKNNYITADIQFILVIKIKLVSLYVFIYYVVLFQTHVRVNHVHV